MNAPPNPADFDHIGFSLAEVESLLSTEPGRSADAMRSVFGVHTAPDGASLELRGYRAGGQLTGEAASIARILTRATRWSVAEAGTGETAQRGILVESPPGKLVARRLNDSAWAFVVLDPHSVVAQAVAQGVRNAARETEQFAATVRTSSHGASRTFAIARTGSSWNFNARPTGAAEPEISVEDSTADEAFEHLAAFVAVWPEPLLA